MSSKGSVSSHAADVSSSDSRRSVSESAGVAGTKSQRSHRPQSNVRLRSSNCAGVSPVGVAVAPVASGGGARRVRTFAPAGLGAAAEGEGGVAGCGCPDEVHGLRVRHVPLEAACCPRRVRSDGARGCRVVSLLEPHGARVRHHLRSRCSTLFRQQGVPRITVCIDREQTLL